MRGHVLGTGEEVVAPFHGGNGVPRDQPRAGGSSLPPQVIALDYGQPYDEPIPKFRDVACNLSEWIPALTLFVVEVILGTVLYHAGNKVVFVLFALNTWLIGLAFHEFSHALVAYWSGDYTVVTKGYLTLNILRYTSAVTSIFIPLLFLLIGGIGLPGGAVFIEQDRIRGKWLETLVSLAGPFASFLSGVIFALPFRWADPADYADSSPHRWFWYGLAFSVFFFFVATILNSLPVPPLDGYGAIRPHLPNECVRTIESDSVYPMLSLFCMLLIFFAFWRIPGATRFLVEMTERFGVPRYVLARSIRAFKLW